MSEELSYYAKMVLQEFTDRSDNLRPGITLSISTLKDIVPESERELVLQELILEHQYLEMVEEKFPGKLILTHKGYHFLRRMKGEQY